jgi:hypothetical protein
MSILILGISISVISITNWITLISYVGFMKSLGMKETINMILKIQFCVSKCVSNES